MSGQVRITYGANQDLVDVPETGLTISQLLERFGSSMNLPNSGDDGTVLVNGETPAAGGDTILRSNDQVEFLRRAGVKG